MTLTIHRLWLGPGYMPARYGRYGHEWARLNPSWRVIDWLGAGVAIEHVEGDLPPNYGAMLFDPSVLTNLKVWDELAQGAVAPVPMDAGVAIATQRADVAGYEIVHRHGGLYVNCDMQPLHPVSALMIPMGAAMVAREDNRFLSNAVMYATGPDHPFWRFVVRELPGRFFANRHKPMNFSTGPYLLTDCFNEWMTLAQEGAPVFVPSIQMFNYALYGQVPLGGDASAYVEQARKWGAVAIHHWGHRGQQHP